MTNISAFDPAGGASEEPTRRNLDPFDAEGFARQRAKARSDAANSLLKGGTREAADAAKAGVQRRIIAQRLNVPENIWPEATSSPTDGDDSNG